MNSRTTTTTSPNSNSSMHDLARFQHPWWRMRRCRTRSALPRAIAAVADGRRTAGQDPSSRPRHSEHGLRPDPATRLHLTCAEGNVALTRCIRMTATCWELRATSM